MAVVRFDGHGCEVRRSRSGTGRRARGDIVDDGQARGCLCAERNRRVCHNAVHGRRRGERRPRTSAVEQLARSAVMVLCNRSAVCRATDADLATAGVCVHVGDNHQQQECHQTDDRECSWLWPRASSHIADPISIVAQQARDVNASGLLSRVEAVYSSQQQQQQQHSAFSSASVMVGASQTSVGPKYWIGPGKT